jgi:hypothetical protein
MTPHIICTIRLRAYDVLLEAVECGAAFAVRRFWKHREDEPPVGLEEAVADEVMSALGDVVDWGDGC